MMPIHVQRPARGLTAYFHGRARLKPQRQELSVDMAALLFRLHCHLGGVPNRMRYPHGKSGPAEPHDDLMPCGDKLDMFRWQ